jgi:hypothetical protein
MRSGRLVRLFLASTIRTQPITAHAQEEAVSGRQRKESQWREFR